MTNATEGLPGTLAKTRGQKLLIPLVLSCAMLIDGIDQTVLATSIPQMAQSLGESPIRLVWFNRLTVVDGSHVSGHQLRKLGSESHS